MNKYPYCVCCGNPVEPYRKNEDTCNKCKWFLIKVKKEQKDNAEYKRQLKENCQRGQ